ncbi:MAG: hypothetical protein AMK72_00345 [Planctomycetes bacterium SM23_25]|nr:MAG: hypothetical protein AMS14_02580 [Planctomycetes bacterium DG_20]KPK51178.1 MAG: hypothetical protein AMK72_00345 [Planctomycetes bacterium SM23_25]
MNRSMLLGIVCLMLSLVMCVAGAASAEEAKPEGQLTGAGEKFLARYTGMLTALQAEIAKAVPKIDAKKRDAFLKAHAAVGGAQPYQDTNSAFAQAQANALRVAKPLLAEVKGFLVSDKLEARLVKGAVLANATPRGLAEFAQQGKKEAKLVDELLADDDLMKQMLAAGGAKAGKYGMAIQSYAEIQEASKHACKGILQRLALGTSLEQAVPLVGHGSVDPVKRYLSYEKAYLDGELDPEFKNMTTWECRFITDDPTLDEEIVWCREMMRNYRPDHIFKSDYRWRYAGIVKSDVAYKSPEWHPEMSTLKMQQLINGGGKCGPRAWFGRFATRAFGIPTWGARQRGHAAMTHWTPDGWTTCFGAHWRWNWWEDRCGLDFLLETQAREYPKDYVKVLRAQWTGDALGESKVNGRNYGTGGGLWNALAFYQKKEIVEEAKPIEVALTGEDLAEANVSTKTEKIMQTEVSEADRKIVIDKGGVITVPAVACSKPTNNTAKIVFMKSFLGGMQLHYNRLGNPEVFEYVIEAPKAGRYALSARVVTVNMNPHLLLALNNAKSAIDIALPYTIGMWEESKPVDISLVKGKNTLRFTRKAPNHGLTIKDFTLKPLK